MSYLKKNIDAMTGYQPGYQPAKGAKVIKLNTNENPYPPSPAAMNVLGRFDADALRLYPDPSATRFRRAVAAVLGVPEDWIIAGNGSDEILSIIMRACAGPEGRTVVWPAPTYVLYRILAQIENAEFVEVPYDDQFNLPVDALATAAAAVTLVASPNSPSGTVSTNEQFSRLAEALAGVLVIDEAYVDFADGDALAVAKKHDNVIVLRTLSKGYSLAGLRMGFAVAHQPLLAGMMKVKDSYNVNAIASAVGAAAIEDQPHKIANARKVKASRAKLTADLERLGFFVWPSQANFLLGRPPNGRAGPLHKALMDNGILVRYFDEPRLDDKLRITVGTDEQNAALVRALETRID